MISKMTRLIRDLGGDNKTLNDTRRILNTHVVMTTIAVRLKVTRLLYRNGMWIAANLSACKARMLQKEER